VGSRLALLALKKAYGKKEPHSGPEFKSMKIKDNEVILSFENQGSGLTSNGEPLKGFSVAGEDGKFIWAEAEIDKNKVIVRSPKVAKPVAVRYGWADFPVVNLFNKEGLPASPFRTDDFKMLTRDRR
jgi:sialate O-acetylesterase